VTKPAAKTVWPEPTRRAFVSMLGAAAAVLALRQGGTAKGKAAKAPPPSLPRWIGHV
jgi:hypothetical protein